MYVLPNGRLSGVNSHPGNYGNVRAVGLSGSQSPEGGDWEGDPGQMDENEDEDATGFFGYGGSPYGLGAFLALKQRTVDTRRPAPASLYSSDRSLYAVGGRRDVPVFTNRQGVYPQQRGVPVKAKRLDSRQTTLGEVGAHIFRTQYR